MRPPRSVKVDFHCHTTFSRDSLVTLNGLQKACRRKGLQKLVVTDHNSIEGALHATELDSELFIIGEEILTQQGELLAIFVSEPVPAHLSAHETLRILRDQGAFISVSHPFDSLRKGHWEFEDLISILPDIDAIEVFNSRSMKPEANQEALAFAKLHRLLGTVGSDAHSLGEIGAATLTLPDFYDTSSLKQALAHAQPHTHLSSPFVHFYSRYAAWRKKRLANVH